MSCNNCGDCMEKLDSYVDRELSEAEVSDILGHIGHCPLCQKLFRLREDMKRLVKLCCAEKAGESLRERIRRLLF